MRRHLTFAALGLTALAVVAPIAIAAWLAYTPAGLRFVVARIPTTIAGATIGIGHISGTLAGGVTLDSFVLEHERVSLRVEHVEGRVALLPLLWQTIAVSDARIGSAFVAVHRRTSPPTRWTPHFLPPLLAIRTDSLRIADATLVLPNGRRFDLENVSGSGAVHPRTIRIFSADLDYQATHGSGSAELRAADPIEIDADSHWTWRVPDQPLWTIGARGTGNLERLAIAVAFTAPLRADFSGAVSQLTGDWHWDGTAVLHDLDLRAWGGGNALGRITGELRLNGNSAGFHARGPVESARLAAGPFEFAFDGNYSDRVLTASRIELVNRESRARLDAAGAIGIASGGPRLDLRGTWHDFRWPLVGREMGVSSPAGAYVLQGLWPYAVTARGPLVLPGVEGNIPFEVTGRLSRTGFRVTTGQATVLDGTLRFTADVAWAPNESWTFAGDVRGLDPSRIRKQFPGKLNFAFDARGNALGARSALDVTVSDLSGRLRGASTRGSGRLFRSGDEWRFREVRAQSGGLRIALDGRIGQQRDLSFDIAADDLTLLGPHSSGSIRARGQLLGTPTAPVLKLVGSGRGIQHEGIAAASLAADIDYDPRADHRSRAKIHGEGVGFAGRAVESFDAALEGTPQLYTVDAAVRAAGVRMTAKASGPLVADGWHATISSLNVDDDKRLALRLDAPANVQFSRTALRTDKVCMHDTAARLCGNLLSQNGTWSGAFDARNVPMSALTAGVSPDVAYQGSLNVAARFAGEPGRPWHGDLRADLRDAGIRHRRPSGGDELLPLGSGIFEVHALPDAIRASLELDAHATGNIRGAVTAQRNGGSWTGMPLRGELRASTDAVGLVTLWVPDIDRAAGRFDADLVLGGTLGAPSLSGVLKLAKGELDLYQVNLALREISLQARLLDNRLDIDASARAGEGAAQVTGTVAWRDGAPHGSLHLTGKELRVINVPEARIFASPDLVFGIDGRRIAVTGKVDVPYARIIPADLTGAVLSSGDEVIASADRGRSSEPFTVRSEIRLTLGDRVSIDTAGLTGRITGILTTTSDAEDVSRGHGELKIEEGKYTAYGRKLDIERGRLIFTGGPVADPGVDIRAIKQFPDVKAGVNVRGTLRTPRMTFFSEPAIPQAQIVSLILAGGSLEALQRSDTTGTDRGSATRNELLAQGGAILAQQLGSKIGLEDVSIESDLANQTSLVLGKYLSPRLYVSYGISLTEAISTFKTRYTLGDRWTMRTEAGKESSADLVYTIEK
ncbi:MAG: translocation/assembly module TamB domain-containing protein [Steroidobacteraceae bacterium]